MSTLLFDVIARDRASKTFDKVGRSASESAAHMDRWKAAGIAAGALVGAALVKFGKDSVGAYSEAQAQQAKLELAFQKFPALADTNIQALRTLNTELEKKTGIDDDATASGQAVLASFKLTGTQITALTPLLQDYAIRTGKDLPTAAQDLGKAVLGQGRALKNVGINFKDAHSAGANFNQLISGLRANVGGYAANQGKTAAGQTKILKAEFEELEETVGSKLVPALTSLVGAGIKVTEFIGNNLSIIGPLVGILGGLAIAVWAVNAAARAYAATQAALNIVLDANPIGLIIIGIAALVAGIVIAYKKSETFRNIVNGAFHAVAAVVGAVVGFIREHWKLLFAILTGPVGLGIAWVVTHFQTIKSTLSKVLAGVTHAITAPFQTAFAIIMAGFHAVEAVAGAVSNIIKGGGGPAHPERLRVPGRAAGGPVRAGVPYIVGERHAELFVPDSSGRIEPSLRSGSTQNVYITVNALDPRQAADAVKEALQAWTLKTGKPVPVRTLGPA